MDVYYGDLSISLDISWYGKNWFVFGKTPQYVTQFTGFVILLMEQSSMGNLQLTIPLRKEDIESKAIQILQITPYKRYSTES
jgi:hypothetical protein